VQQTKTLPPRQLQVGRERLQEQPPGWSSRTCKELEAKKGSSNKEVLNEREQ